MGYVCPSLKKGRTKTKKRNEKRPDLKKIQNCLTHNALKISR